MRFNWWMAPLAVLLVLAGIAGGLVLSRPKAPAAVAPGKVQAPVAGAPKPVAGGGGTQQQPQPQPPTEPTPPPPQQPAPKRPADAEAQAFIRALMQARISGDAPKVASMVAAGAVGDGGIRVSGAGARITGYTADLLGSGDFDHFIFRLKVAFATPQPGGEVAAEEVQVSWNGGLKVAAYTEKPKESLALTVGQDGKLYLHRGQETALAGDLAMLPAQFTPWGASAEVQFGVGKEGWAVAAVNTSGTHVLWVTKGLHPLLGISQVTWGSNPVMTPLDLLFEAGGVDAAWAPGSSRYVAVTVAQPSGATTLFVYDVTAKQKLAPDLGVLLGTQDFTVKNIRWLSGTVIAFDLQQASGTTGPYTYDVVAKTVKKP